MDYLFETNEFGLSNDSFHLLRSRYNFKTYSNQDIASLSIENGKQINNWILVLIIGVSLISFTIFYSIKLFYFMTDEQTRTIYIEQIVIPVLPFLVGIYCLFVSLKKGPIIRVQLRNGRTKGFPLSKVQKENQMESLLDVFKNSTEFGQKLTVGI